jgi:Zn finger protein HypA/HybF involved in hydrogenase expression
MRRELGTCIVDGSAREEEVPMKKTTTPVDRTMIVFEAEPSPALRCSHCGAAVTDADAECPTCESPIDWGASGDALRSWEQSGAR